MKTYFLLGVIALVMTACSPEYSYFTQDLYKKERWSEEEIRRIQFYVSRDIVLRRVLKEGESLITDGKIRIKDGRKIEEVVIKSGTPGVLVLMPKEDRFAVSFEATDNEAYLMFGPNPKYYDRYALLAQDWTKESGKVHYRGQVYDVDAQGAYASLLVDLKRIGEHDYQSRKVQGRLVKG